MMVQKILIASQAVTTPWQKDPKTTQAYIHTCILYIHVSILSYVHTYIIMYPYIHTYIQMVKHTHHTVRMHYTAREIQY